MLFILYSLFFFFGIKLVHLVGVKSSVPVVGKKEINKINRKLGIVVVVTTIMMMLMTFDASSVR